jgi:hypothetical protein
MISHAQRFIGLCSLFCLAGCYQLSFKSFVPKDGGQDSPAASGGSAGGQPGTGGDGGGGGAGGEATESGGTTGTGGVTDTGGSDPGGAGNGGSSGLDAPVIRPEAGFGRPDGTGFLFEAGVGREAGIRPTDTMPDMPLAQISTNVSRLDFPSVVLGTTSAEQSFTITNTGGAIGGLLIGSANGEFVIQTGSPGDCASPSNLGVGESCSVRVVFKPTTAGSRSGSITWSPLGGVRAE